MIRNNLAVLMAQRGTKISKIAADTGIARSTLNAIAQNESKMIQLETIDKLCQELDVTPCEFFSYLPTNITIYSDDLSVEFDTQIFEGEYNLNELVIKKLNYSLVITISGKFGKNSYSFLVELTEPAHFTIAGLETLKLTARLDEEEKEYKEFKAEWNDMPIDFRVDIEKEILSKFYELIIKDMPELIDNDNQAFVTSDTKSSAIFELSNLTANLYIAV